MSNSLFGLPEEVVFCKLCVISNQRPSSAVEMVSGGANKVGINITDGVCDACKYAEVKLRDIDWDIRSDQFYNLLKPFRKNNGDYDVIVPSSGGKDSSYTAYLLKHKYDMNPLAITWAPTMFTEVGRTNLETLTKVGQVDSMLCTPNGKLHGYLTRLAFLNLCHPFQPFVHGQKIVGPKYASKLGIGLVVYGENQAEYGNNIKENETPFMDSKFFSIKNPLEMRFGGQTVESIISNTDFELKDFSSYIPLENKQSSKSKIKMTYLGFFEKWDPQEIYYFVTENIGFRPSPERSEGTYSRYTEIDDKIVPIHFYTTFIKFGLGRATYDACQEIRNGHIDRDEAISLVNKFDGEFPQTWFEDFLELTKINREEFFETIDKNRSPHLWERTGNGYTLKHRITNA